MSTQSLTRRVQKLESVLQPVAKDTRLPYIVVNEDGSDWQGYEAHNQEHRALAKRKRIPPDVYSFDVNAMGTEP